MVKNHHQMKENMKMKRSPKQSGKAGLAESKVRQNLLALVSSAEYHPLKIDELRRELKVAASQQDNFAQVVNGLIDNGTLVRLRKKGIALAESADLLAGHISFTPSGAAFVTMIASTKTVFVPARETGTAFHGDKVLVRINRGKQRKPGNDLEEAQVIRILERKRLTVVGVLKQVRRMYYVQPMQSRLVHDILVPDPGRAKIGDRVLVQLEPWEDASVSPDGVITEVIGPADDPSLDTLAVLKAYDLTDNFPAAVTHAAESATICDKDLEGRLDLRKKFIFTIDPETARDFDDALSLEKTSSGNWKLGVHIADVSHFVQSGSALDQEAYRRATSTYLPDKVVPMLPEQLSNGLCSLSANVDRLAFSVFISLDKHARVKRVSFRTSVIRSKLRLHYKQALAVLQLPAGTAYPEAGVSGKASHLIHQLHKLAQMRRDQRLEDGALLMDIPEAKFKIGPDGRIEDVCPVENDVSHQLVEECMLLANETVCRKMAKAGMVQLHRIHAEPDPEQLAELEDMFRLGGINPGDLSDRRNLSRLLLEVKDMPPAQAWYISVLRSMKRAEYSIEAVGHYGLAKEYYAHFTSPIRRYPDLVTHRLLKSLLDKKPSPYNRDQLQEIALHASDRSQVAAEAEREVTELKIVRFFSEQIKSGDIREYDAVVVDVRNLGAFVDVPQVRASGLVHVSELADDFYDFEPARKELRGRRSGRVLALGTKLKVIIAKVDETRKRLDFAAVGFEAPTRDKKKKPSPSRRRGRKNSAERDVIPPKAARAEGKPKKKIKTSPKKGRKPGGARKPKKDA
jgi:ribonuclease R